MTAGAFAHPSESAASDARHAERAAGLSIGATIEHLIDRRRGFWRQYGLHTALAGVAAAVFLFSEVSVPQARIALSRNWVVPAGIHLQLSDERDTAIRGLEPVSASYGERYLERAAVPRTTHAEYPEWQPFHYTVQAGDTLSTLAARFNLDERTLAWANSEVITDADELSIGDDLLILPLDGAYHVVAAGETLQSIAEKYSVPAETIVAYKGNTIADPNALEPGMRLVVPGAALPDVPRPTPAPSLASSYSYDSNDNQTLTASADGSTQGSGELAWPLSGLITQYFTGYHRGIDIYTPSGYPVTAADSGTVVLVSWLTYSYGYHIIIDHGNGLETLYAHLNAIEVEVGQTVTKGQEVGIVGTTGRVTGPHLHFEVRDNGTARNPFNYLP